MGFTCRVRPQSCFVSPVKLVTTLSHDLPPYSPQDALAVLEVELFSAHTWFNRFKMMCWVFMQKQRNHTNSTAGESEISALFVRELNKHLCSLKDSSSRGTIDLFRTRHQTFNNTNTLYPPKTNWCYSPFANSEQGRRNSKEYMLPFWRPVTRATPAQRGRGNKNGQFLVAYHYCDDHLCFQGNKSVIWIREAFKMGIASYRGRNCRPLARELARYWYSLCVSHTLHLAPEHRSWKKALRARMKQIHLHFFLWQLELAGVIGGCIPWRLGCSAIYWWTPLGEWRDAATQVGGGCNIKRFSFNPYYLLFHVTIDLYRQWASFQSKCANRGRWTVRLLNWEIRDNLRKTTRCGETRTQKHHFKKGLSLQMTSLIQAGATHLRAKKQPFSHMTAS